IDQKYAKETAQLNPAHRFVPWVVVNNQALQELECAPLKVSDSIFPGANFGGLVYTEQIKLRF
ncbi:gamma-interferon-inducible lysosomal thiol reductase-like protein, partial [Trifolium pratense]